MTGITLDIPTKGNQQGFTIVELLIVIVVIAILAAISVVAYNGIQSRAKTASATAALSDWKNAMLGYKIAYSELPPTGDAWNYDTNPPSCGYITALVTQLANEGYRNLPATDPWGSCFGYDDNDCNTGSPAGSPSYLRSVGPDKLNATSDDINLLISSGC